MLFDGLFFRIPPEVSLTPSFPQKTQKHTFYAHFTSQNNLFKKPFPGLPGSPSKYLLEIPQGPSQGLKGPKRASYKGLLRVLQEPYKSPSLGLLAVHQKKNLF